MKLRSTLCAAAIVSVASTLLGMGAYQSETNSSNPADHDVAAMMKRWTDSCTPNENHARLAGFVGTWDTETSMWMEGPGGKAAKSKGTSEIRWLDANRWLIEESKGEMMGMPMRATTILGYDNYKTKYVSTTVNSLTTQLLTAEGNFDKDRKNLITYGTMDEPMTGEHDKCVRYVTRLVDADKFVFEVHDLAIGETNTKVVEVVYTRKKS